MPSAASAARRKELGAFYTPPEMAAKLVDWAVRSPTDRVLDPSFGGLVFLASARRRLLELGGEDDAVREQLLGVDLDDDAHAATDASDELRLSPASLLHQDFFAVKPEADVPLCAAVVGNPPYIRYQGWKGAEARALCAAAGVHLTRLASSWAPFVVHSTAFVAPGGRLAMVLPGEMLHAQYAHEVDAFLRRSYRRLRLVVFEQRVFPGALEEVVLLLAEGRGEPGSGVIELIECDSLSDLNIQRLLDAPARTPSSPSGGAEKLLAQLLPERSRTVYARLANDDRVSPLGSFGSVGIGAVTGDNSFFLLDDVRAERVPRELLAPAVSKARHVQGIRFRESDLTRLREEGQPMRMFLADSKTDNNLLARADAFLDEGRKRKVHERYKCRVRKPWYAVPIPGGGAPDLFLTYCSNEHPRLVLNDVRALSTNTLHGVHLSDAGVAQALAVGFLNSLSLLSAELLGRSYGGGVLKLEPTEAQSVLLPPLDAAAALADDVDRLLREKGLEGVLTYTDRELLEKGLGLSEDDVRALRDGHTKLRRRRQARGRSRV